MCPNSAERHEQLYCEFVKHFRDYSGGACSNIINVELVQQRIEKLKKGKAAGINKLTTQHINLAHPLLVVHLSMSFQIMLTHSVVLFF